MGKIDTLIQEGQTLNFNNNSHTSSTGRYTKASTELLAWVTKVEDFIRGNYGEDSAAFRQYEYFDRMVLNGYDEAHFDQQMNVLLGALRACKDIPPKPANERKSDNPIMQLLMNLYFWGAIVIIIGGTFTVAMLIGSAKFDKEKIDFYNTSVGLSKDTANLYQIIAFKDSIIKQKDSIIAIKQDSIVLTTNKLNNLYLLLGSKLNQ